MYWLPAIIFSLFAAPCFGAWQIYDRPLDPRPWSRQLQSPVTFGKSHHGILDGNGLSLQAGQTSTFNVVIETTNRTKFEFQLGYLTNDKKPKSTSCEFEIRHAVEGKQSSSKTVIPLLSILPENQPIADIGARFDYFLNATVMPLDVQGTHRFEIQPAANCTDGELLLFDPKVWEQVDREPRQLIVMVLDSIGSALVDTEPDKMPITRKFFSGSSAHFTTKVISPASNTHDMTWSLSHMWPVARESKLFLPKPDQAKGFLPPLYNAGFDVINMSSNYLLVNELSKAGFRSLLSFDISGSKNNNRNAEARVGMAIDWFEKHPDHDVVMFMWFDATHAWVESNLKDKIDITSLPYNNLRKEVVPTVINQMANMMWLDQLFDRLYTHKVSANANYVMFSDHGINYAALQKAIPIWPKCQKDTAVANKHMHRIESDIFLGVKLSKGTPPRPKSLSSSFEWIKTVVAQQFPEVSISNWHGRVLKDDSPESPIITLGHYGRGSIRTGDEIFYFRDKDCKDEANLIVLNEEESFANAEETEYVASILTETGFLPLHRIDIQALLADHQCSIVARTTGFLTNETSWHIQQPAWFEERSFFFRPVANNDLLDVAFTTTPPGCAMLSVGPLVRTIEGELSTKQAGLNHIFGFPAGPASFNPNKQTGAKIQISKSTDRYYQENGQFFKVSDQNDSISDAMKASMVEAMKSWGYIQDE